MSASCDKPEHKDLPPLRHLVEHLHWGCTGQAQQVWLIEAVFAEHAHELAEKIRHGAVRYDLRAFNAAQAAGGGRVLEFVQSAIADHLDPEVTE